MKASTPAATPVLVELIDGQPTTTSLDVADHFGKRHDTVLRAVRQLECTPEFHARNFAEMIVEAEIGKGATRSSPAFRLTRDGFTFLCMGFTGKEAARWKEAYINAFNQLEHTLQHGAPTPTKRQPKALPNGLTVDQQASIKALVKARVEALPEGRRAKAAITCWSALKSKFGCTYKAIEPAQFTEAVSLVARLPLEGEWLGNEHPAQALAESDLPNILALARHAQRVGALYRKYDLYGVFGRLGSSAGVELHDHVVSAAALGDALSHKISTSHPTAHPKRPA